MRIFAWLWVCLSLTPKNETIQNANIQMTTLKCNKNIQYFEIFYLVFPLLKKYFYKCKKAGIFLAPFGLYTNLPVSLTHHIYCKIHLKCNFSKCITFFKICLFLPDYEFVYHWRPHYYRLILNTHKFSLKNIFISYEIWIVLVG